MKRKNLTKLQRAQAIYLYENNIDMIDIARFFKKDTSSMWRLLKKNDVKQKSIKDLLKTFVRMED